MNAAGELRVRDRLVVEHLVDWVRTGGLKTESILVCGDEGEALAALEAVGREASKDGFEACRVDGVDDVDSAEGFWSRAREALGEAPSKQGDTMAIEDRCVRTGLRPMLLVKGYGAMLARMPVSEQRVLQREHFAKGFISVVGTGPEGWKEDCDPRAPLYDKVVVLDTRLNVIDRPLKWDRERYGPTS